MLYLHSYLDKWIQEFQEEEECSAANGGQRHPKRNKGKGKHNSRMSLQYYMTLDRKIQAARGGLEIPNDWDQGVFSESNRLYNEEKKRMMGIPTDAAAVPDGKRSQVSQWMTISLSLLKFAQLIDCVKCRIQIA